MDWLPVLAHEVDVFTRTIRAASATDLERPIVACPGWTVRDLVVHVGAIERWVGHAVRELELLDHHPTWPGTDLAGWYEEGASELLRLLDVDPETPAPTFADEQTVGFWQRRQVHEHRVHRWDLEQALGTPEPIESALATDGLDEIASMFWPRQVRLGRAQLPARGLRVKTDDTAREWVFGENAVATLSGPAADVLLVLMHRRDADGCTLNWSGDVQQGRAVLALPLSP